MSRELACFSAAICKEPKDHTQTASPSAQAGNEEGMRKTLRVKAEIGVPWVWKQDLLCRSPCSRAEYTQVVGGLQAGGCLLHWHPGCETKTSQQHVCFCKSKQQDPAPGEMEDGHNTCIQWESLTGECCAIRAERKCSQKRALKGSGCRSTSCSAHFC